MKICGFIEEPELLAMPVANRLHLEKWSVLDETVPARKFFATETMTAAVPVLKVISFLLGEC